MKKVSEVMTRDVITVGPGASIHEAARLLVERHGMTPVFETARMYTGTAPTLPLERIFGVTSFELG